MANEIRVRRNNISGTITDNPLAIGATTINSAGFADLPVVGGTQHMILILDPLEVGGTAEVVMVTAHTAAATSVTVVRGQEGSVARSHVFNTTWFHGPVVSDTIDVLTSSTRPVVPYEGQLIYETDTNKFVGYDVVGWAPRDAGGRVAYAQAVADQNTIAAATLVDVTSCTVTWTAVSSRLYKTTGQLLIQKDGTSSNLDARISDAASSEKQRLGQCGFAANELQVFSGSVVESGLSGPITRKLQVFSSVGSASLLAAASRPNFILVEDIGAA